MKTIRLTAFFLVLPLVFHAQTLTGLWAGTLTNDSSTVRRDQSFEIVLTEYRGKVFGYSRMTFFVRDTLYYIVKRVRGTVEGDVCEVKDDYVISHNFPHKPDKGVKLISTFRRNQQDSTWRLDGDWKTTESKKHRYYSVSGKISLKSEPDLEKSRILPHLEELKVADDVAFYQEAKKEKEALAAKQATAAAKKPPVTKEEKPAIAPAKETRKDEIAKATAKPVTTPETKPAPPARKDEPVVKDEKVIKTEPVAAVSQKPVIITASEQPVKKETPPVAKTTEPVVPVKTEPVAVNKPTANQNIQQRPAVTEQKTAAVTPVREVKKEEPKISQASRPPAQPVTIKPADQKKETIESTAKTETVKPVAEKPIATVTREEKPSLASLPEVNLVVPQGATFVNERKLGAPQTIYFKSDSLELKLYDNGEIDGDTVSVLINGELVLAKQGLKATAIRKTIYLPAGTKDSMTLVLYAENLGKYPPNTGLLVVNDGDDIYQIRFSADLQQNAAIVFRRKRN